MSLLKLLSAGKSLDGSKPMPSPYRMKPGNLLPKFGSRKNPFAPGPKAEPSKPEADDKPAQMETDSLFETEPETPLAPFRKAPVKKEAKPAPEPKAEPKPEAVAPAPPPAKEAKPGILSGLVKKLNPLAYLPKRRPEGRSIRPKAARSAVQGELSLERVRVLRNELNDSDLEFVAAKPASSGTAGTMLPAMTRPKLTTWGRLTFRVMSGAETQTQT